MDAKFVYLPVNNGGKCYYQNYHACLSLSATMPTCQVIGIVCLSSPCNKSGFFISLSMHEQYQSYNLWANISCSPICIIILIMWYCWLITLSHWKLKWISLFVCDIIRLGKATCIMKMLAVLFGCGIFLWHVHFDHYSEVFIFSMSSLWYCTSRF